MKILLCLLLVTFISASVVGIDLGSQYFKAFLVKPGQPFTIVENTASHWKTPTGISFTKEEWLYGLDAINNQKAFLFTWDLIGVPYDQALVDALKQKHYVFNDLVEDEWGLVGFKVEFDEEVSGTYSGEEIMAMILKHAKDLAET